MTKLILAAFFAFQQTPKIDRLAWLQGCWETSSPQRTIEEQWTSPLAGSMIGMGRTVRAGKLVEYEFVIIREQSDRLAYEAHPSGQPSAVFLSNTATDEMVVFENPEHDFPQKVGYQRMGADSLLAWIEGNDKGKPRRIEFAYRRATCGAK